MTATKLARRSRNFCIYARLVPDSRQTEQVSTDLLCASPEAPINMAVMRLSALSITAIAMDAITFTKYVFDAFGTILVDILHHMINASLQ